MTKEQKVEWFANADMDVLLNQYESAVRRADKAWEIVARDSRYTIEGIFEDLELVKAEVIKRMSR